MTDSTITIELTEAEADLVAELLDREAEGLEDGGEGDPEDIERLREFAQRVWDARREALDRDGETKLRAELRQLEAALDANGGRGVELAERIDEIREELGETL